MCKARGNRLTYELSNEGLDLASPSTDKFAGLAVREGLQGVPLLEDALAHIECEVVDRIIGGTHTIFVGRVISADVADGQPLTYFRGGFGRFAQARDEAVYRTVRGLVLTRHARPEDVVTVAELATALDAEEPSVFYALTRLAGDGLVRRELGGGYLVLPFDISSSDATFDARLLIELGVLEQVVGSTPDSAIAELRRDFEKMASLLVDDHFVDFDSYLEANYKFHEGLISLAENPLLTSVFEGLAIKQVMTRSFGATSESSQFFVDVQRQIMDASEAEDKAAAQDAARTYSSIAKARAREVLALSGGAV